MAIRFLYFGRYHIWCLFIILVAFSPVTDAGPKYVKVKTQGVAKAEGHNTYDSFSDWWLRETLQQAFDGGQTTSTSTVPGSKPHNVPAVIKPIANAGKVLAKAARLTSPALLAAELISYLTEHNNPNPGMEYCEGDWNKECIQDSIEIGTHLWGIGPTTIEEGRADPEALARENCTAPDTVVNQDSLGRWRCTDTAVTYVYWTVTTIYNCASEGPGVYAVDGGCTEEPCDPEQEWDPIAVTCTMNEIIPLSEEDWEVIEEGTYRPMTDTELDKMVESPSGLPIQPPTHPSLPELVPTSEAYQPPGSSGWVQPVTEIGPGPYPSVTTDSKIIPVTGPSGIDDPVVEDPTRPEEEVSIEDPETTSTEERLTVEVEVCAEGDTRLICTELGTPPTEPEPEPDTFELDFDHAPVVFTEGACPAGPTASTPWGTVTFDMYWPCEFAKAIKPIILALGAFAAAYIFVGGLRTS